MSNNNVTLSHYSGAVLDQGAWGTCMQHALVAAIDLQMRQSHQEIGPLSRLQSYWDTREAQAQTTVDKGSVPEVTLNQSVLKGIADESLWGYSSQNLYNKPTTDVYADASTQKVLSWSAIKLNVTSTGIQEQIRELLKEGKPVILAFKAGSAFFGQSGPLQTQTNSWAFGEQGLGHAVLIERVDDSLDGTYGPLIGGSYVVKNSWGTSWGDKGYGTINYNQFHPHSEDMIGAFTINGFAGVDWTYTASKKNIAQLYAVIFERSPELQGLNFWFGILNSGWTEAQIAQTFIDSAEGASIYGGMTNGQFVDEMYENILGRDADQAGYDYFVGLLNSGSLTRGQIMSSTLDFIADYTGTDAGTLDSKSLVKNKESVAMYYSVAMQIDTEHQQQIAIDSITDITSDYASVEIAKIGIAQDLGWL